MTLRVQPFKVTLMSRELTDRSAPYDFLLVIHNNHRRKLLSPHHSSEIKERPPTWSCDVWKVFDHFGETSIVFLANLRRIQQQ